MTGLRIEAQQHTALSLEGKQGITLLSFSSLELSDYLRDCIESNPFLQEDERSRCKHPLEAGTTQHLSAENFAYQAEKRHTFNHKIRQQQDYAQENFQQQVTDKLELIEYLSSQAGLIFKTSQELSIVERIIRDVDRCGYLVCCIEDIAADCEVSPKRAEEILAALQQNVAAGLLARNLAECLRLQLQSHYSEQRDNDTLAIAYHILENHLHDLAKGKVAHIAACLKVTPTEVQAAHDMLRSCDPKPGLNFSQESIPSIWPEVVVERVKNNGFCVRLCEFNLPKPLIDSTYLEILQAKKIDRETRQYLEGEYRRATSLLSGIERRALAIKNIAIALVGRQYQYFEEGPGHLLPLTMAEIAETVGLSESTVSRVSNGTYLQTEYGLIEMRRLFSTALTSREGGQSSQADALYRLRLLIEGEDARNPLSDADLSEILGEELGVCVSRRTVNKYRNTLGIPTQSLRRRYTESA